MLVCQDGGPWQSNLENKPWKHKLVLESSASDKGWKRLFLFVKKGSLGREGLWLGEDWSATGIFRFFVNIWLVMFDSGLTACFCRLGIPGFWHPFCEAVGSILVPPP